jgi:hypothetical protein
MLDIGPKVLLVGSIVVVALGIFGLVIQYLIIRHAVSNGIRMAIATLAGQGRLAEAKQMRDDFADVVNRVSKLVDVDGGYYQPDRHSYQDGDEQDNHPLARLRERDRQV